MAKLMVKLQTYYLDYRNAFLTVERFASWYGFEIEQAQRVIRLGEKSHERIVRRLKSK